MKPTITLFMLESLDGKITSGDSDSLDADKDWCTLEGVKEGLHQYYEIEQTTDLYSLNTGRVMAKIGINERTDEPHKSPVSFILIDNKPHLNEHGLRYLSKWVKQVIIVTTNKNHPSISLKKECENIDTLIYDEIDLEKVLNDLADTYDIKRITLQSGGTMNGLFLHNKLIDYVHLVIAPLLVGGKTTTTLVDGEAIHSRDELDKLGALELQNCKVLEDSYIELEYKVLK